jgi:hypothetical protein
MKIINLLRDIYTELKRLNKNMERNRITSLRKHKFRQFERRVWKEAELNRRNGIRFEPYRAAAKAAASGDESRET